jgi:hypothetical protein
MSIFVNPFKSQCLLYVPPCLIAITIPTKLVFSIRFAQYKSRHLNTLTHKSVNCENFPEHKVGVTDPLEPFVK